MHLIGDCNNYLNMKKQQDKSGINLITEIKKEKVIGYPFHILSTTYQQDNFYFIFTVDYSNDTTYISINTFHKNLQKFATTNISLSDLVPKKSVGIIKVLKMQFKATNTSLNPTMILMVIGFRSGHLLLIEFKGKDGRILQKLNKSISKEGFLSRATSSFFSSDESYSLFIKHPIREFKIHEPLVVALSKANYSYQAGNTIIFHEKLSEKIESKLFNAYESIQWPDLQITQSSDQNFTVAQYICLASVNYRIIVQKGLKMCYFQFFNEVCSYSVYGTKQKCFLSVGLSAIGKILLIDLASKKLSYVIDIDVQIRRVIQFSYQSDDYFVILPYENYVLLYKISTNTLCKIGGHKSFIANVMHQQIGRQKDWKLIICGMDHSISLIALEQIEENKWRKATKSNKGWKIQESKLIDQNPPQKYIISSNPQSRSTAQSYGFANSFRLGKYLCLHTYDCKISLYEYI